MSEFSFQDGLVNGGVHEQQGKAINEVFDGDGVQAQCHILGVVVKNDGYGGENAVDKEKRDEGKEKTDIKTSHPGCFEIKDVQSE